MSEFIKTKKCARCKSPFKSNLLIKGDDTCPTCERMNSITFWLPRLQELQFPVPETIIVNADCDLSPLSDGKPPIGATRFFNELERAINIVGLPAFIRTEMTSNKHDWERSCFLKDKKELRKHIQSLVEFSYIATIDRVLPYAFFAVREFIETEPAFNYFPGNMPITKEVRAFVRDGKIECKHAYWPSEAFKNIDKDLLAKVQILGSADEEITTKMASYISQRFSGYWSIDLLKAKSGEWYCTDMAIGERSYHDPSCKSKK